MHNNNSGVFRLKGSNNVCSRAIYRVTFNANIAVSEGKKVDKIYYENSSKEIELLKTTFYNAKKKDEILAQYKKQSKKYTSDKISLKEFADSIYESYKFYEPTY